MIRTMKDRVLIWLFKHLSRSNLTRENRALFTGYLLKSIDGVPVRDIINVNEEGDLLVEGRPLTLDELHAFKNMAKGLLDNLLLKTIWDQIRYQCFKMGVSEGINSDSILFARTALWFGEQERQWLRLFAGATDGN